MEAVRLLAAALGPTILLLATALVLGRAALRRVPTRGPLEEALLGLTVGLGLLGTGLLGLGLLHLLRPGVLLALIAVVHAVAARWWWQAARAAALAARRAPRRTLGAAIAIGVGLGPLVWLALYPPTGYDATAYHLPYARGFARAHAVPFLEDVWPPIMPQLQELLFAAGLALGGETVPHLLQLASALVVALLLLAWRPGSPSRAARLWAAALWLGTPHVVWLSGAAYIDLGLALQAVASVYAAQRAREPGSGRVAWWAVAGACAGFAAASKYLGLFFMLAGLMAAGTARGPGRRPVPLAAFAGATAAAAGPWYVRLWVETGNPLFPLFSRWFGAGAWDPAADPSLVAGLPMILAPWPGLPAAATWAGDALAFLLWLPWNALVHRDLFARQAPLSPYYLVLLPSLLPVAVARRRTRPLALLALAYALTWLLTFRDLRYLLPIWPLLDLALMETAVAMLGVAWPAALRRRVVTVALALALVAPGWLYAIHHLARQGRLPVTTEAREAYLTAWVPGHDAVAWLNARHGASYTVYALYGARLAYYAEGRLRGGWTGPASYSPILRVLEDAEALDGELEALGAEYFLVVTAERPVPLPDTDAWRARFSLVRRGSAMALFHRTGQAAAPAPL